MKLRNNGFTIVELLIVIVILAILAAITITAFNGVQQRARNSARLAQLKQVDKLFELYHTANGKYPDFPMNGGVSYCVGTGFPGGKCYESVAENTPVTATINNQLSTVGKPPSDNHNPINGIAGPFIYVEDTNIFELVNVFEGSTCPSAYPLIDSTSTPGLIYCWRTIDIRS